MTDMTDWFRTLSKIALKLNLCEFFFFFFIMALCCECLFLFADTASDSNANKVGKNLMKGTVKHTALDARSYFCQNEDGKESRRSQWPLTKQCLFAVIPKGIWTIIDTIPHHRLLSAYRLTTSGDIKAKAANEILKPLRQKLFFRWCEVYWLLTEL